MSYVNTFSGQSGQSIFRAQMNDQFDAIVAAFGLLEADMNRSIRAPSGEILSVLPTAADRANTYLQFGVDGDVLGFLTPVKAHTGATVNPPSIKKLTNIDDADKWYPTISVIAGSASGSSDQTLANWVSQTLDGSSSGSAIHALTYYTKNAVNGTIQVENAGTYLICLQCNPKNTVTAIEIEINSASVSPALISENPAGVTSAVRKWVTVMGTLTLSEDDIIRGRMITSASSDVTDMSMLVIKVA